MAISVVDLCTKVLPADDWIIPGLLARRNTAFMMGPPKKASKSWLSLAATWDLSEGKAVWGIAGMLPPRPMRSVYFTQEDTEKNIQDRVKKNIDVGKRTPNNLIWVQPKNLNIKLDTPKGCDIIKRELDAVAKDGPIDLVVFDPMRRIHNGEENDSTVIAQLWARLEAIHNDYNCSTLIVHHITKPPTDRSTYDPTDPYHGRGSGDIYGGGDAFIMVVPGPLAPDGRAWRRLSLHFESKRGEQIPPAELKIRFGDGQVEYMGAGALNL